jgi:hypothetical protein
MTGRDAGESLDRIVDTLHWPNIGDQPDEPRFRGNVASCPRLRGNVIMGATPL